MNVNKRRIDQAREKIDRSKHRKAIEAYSMVMKAIKDLPLGNRLTIALWVFTGGLAYRSLPILWWRLFCYRVAGMFPSTWLPTLLMPIGGKANG